MSREEEFHPILNPVINRSYEAIFTYISAPVCDPDHFVLSMLQAAKIAAYYQECKRPLPPFYFLLDSRVCFGPNPETRSKWMDEQLPKLLKLMLSFRGRKDLGWELYGPGIFSAMNSAREVVQEFPKGHFVLDTTFYDIRYRDQLLSVLAPYFWITNTDPADYLPRDKIHFIRHENRGCAMVVSGASDGYFRRMTDKLCVGKTGMDQHPCVIENAQDTLLTRHFSTFFHLGYSSVLYVSALGPIQYPSQTLFFTGTAPRSAEKRVVYYEIMPSLPPDACVLNGLQNTSHVIFSDSLRCRERIAGAILFAAYLFSTLEISNLPEFHFFSVDASGVVRKQIEDFMKRARFENQERFVTFLSQIIWHDAGDALWHLIAKATAPFVFAENVGTIADVMKKPNALAFQLDQDYYGYLNRTMPSVVSVLCKLTSPEIISAIAELQTFFARATYRNDLPFKERFLEIAKNLSVYIQLYGQLVGVLRAPQSGLKKCQDEFTALLLNDGVFSKRRKQQLDSSEFLKSDDDCDEEQFTVARR